MRVRSSLEVTVVTLPSSVVEEVYKELLVMGRGLRVGNSWSVRFHKWLTWSPLEVTGVTLPSLLVGGVHQATSRGFRVSSGSVRPVDWV